MSDKQVAELADRADTLLKLRKAPSQYVILYQLLSTGRTMSVKEISTELGITPKATERGVAKLLEKNLVQRAPFKDGGYICDQKQIILSLLLATSDLYEDYQRRVPQPVKAQPLVPEVAEAPRPLPT